MNINNVQNILQKWTSQTMFTVLHINYTRRIKVST